MDKVLMIELHIDNIMRGLLKLDFYKEENRKNLLKDMMLWNKLCNDKSKKDEFNQLTDKLYDLIFIYRASRQIEGELKEIENEKIIVSLKQQVSNLDEANKRLADEVTKYKPQQQPIGYHAHG